ncbi:MAG TPA: heme exporter protein CcmD [Gammaproteobacteria bacterium]|nr:heme exporter protein CcmD [Gammaproteobacteria bacterium]
MNSLHEFLTMGGYAAFVWPAYGVVAVVMIANVVIARRRHRRVLEALQRRVELDGREVA